MMERKKTNNWLDVRMFIVTIFEKLYFLPKKYFIIVTV